MKKIEYATGAAGLFIYHLHQENFDRGLIATFGNTFRVEQDFTSNETYLHNVLRRLPDTVTDLVTRDRGERTRLYDSIEDMIAAFWKSAKRDRPWLLTIITDGQDNESTKYRHDDWRSPANIGRYIAQHFNHEATNFPFLIGVGDEPNINAKALGQIGNSGGFPAVTIAAFPLLELIFLRIALSVTTQLVGRRIEIGSMSWEEVAQLRQLSRIPIDYAFLIDRSGSMSESGD